MKIEVQRGGRRLIFRLSGRLDAFGSKELEVALKAEGAGDGTDAVVDMADVNYLSSAGIRVLLALYKRAAAKGGKMALSALQPYCRSVLEVAGFTGMFPLFDSAEAAIAALTGGGPGESGTAWLDRAETFDAECGAFQIAPASAEPGAIEVLGNIQDVLYARVTKGHLRSKRFFDKDYSIGLGGLGERPDDYFHLMGEMITVGGTMVWLPTDGHDTPDFLIPKTDTGEVTLRTAFNVSIAADFNEWMVFRSRDEGGATMAALYRALFDLAKRRRPEFKGVLGLTLRAQMGSIFGSGVTKSPVADFAPADGEMIVHPAHFASWFEFDKAPRHANVTALICGIGADLSGDLSGYDQGLLNSVFYLNPANVGRQDMLLHNHAVIFNRLPWPERPARLEEEIGAVVEQGEFVDMRHLLDGSTVTQALIGVSYVEAFRRDPESHAQA
jgi:anti-anti-sigma factor